VKDPASLKPSFLSLFVGLALLFSPLARAQFPFPLPGGGGIPDLTELTGAMTGLVGQFNDFNARLDVTNQQLALGNQNVEQSNQLWGVTNQHWESSNQNWVESNRIGVEANQNWANSNQIATQANQNWATTNQEAARANENWATTNQEIVNTREMMDRQLTTYRQTLTDFQQTVARESDRFNSNVERMSRPEYIFKAAAYGAAGAVLGATLMKAAITGVTQGLKLVVRWASGDIKKMKMRESMALLHAAMTELKTARALIRNSERTIDSMLTLFKVVKTMSAGSQELLEIAILAQMESVRAQIERLRSEKPQGYEFQVAVLQLDQESLGKVAQALKDHAFQNFCDDLIPLFLELGQAEALTQRAALSILTHERGFLYQKNRELKLLEKQARSVRKGRESRGAMKLSIRIHSNARELTVDQFFDMRKKSIRRCFSVFKSERSLRKLLGRREILGRCQAHFRKQSASSTLLGMEVSFPEAKPELLKKARGKKISEWMQKTAVALHDDAQALSGQGWSAYQMDQGAALLDPMVTVSLARYLAEIEAVQDFFSDLKSQTALPGNQNSRLLERRQAAKKACLL
jgi:hypothetical protein